MKFAFTARGLREYRALPAVLQNAVDKQLVSLLRNLRHPSLNAKKYDQANDVWQARVSRSHRFYFRIEDGVYVILAITPHPK
jgi:hypothetical protein